MKYVEEYLKDVIKIKPLGELTTKDDELNGMSGEMVYIDGKCSDIFISHADYTNWLEKQGEQKPYGQRKECLDCQFNYAGECKGSCVMKRSEQKPTDKVGPKFKVGDWVTNDYCAGKVIELTNDAYLLDTGQGIPFSCEHNVHLWTIQDAKDGDVLVCPPLGYASGEQVFIFKGINSRDYVDNCIEYYCCIYEGVFYENINAYMGTTSTPLYPATKEQRDILFTKMREAGYVWDSEEKELKKIEDEPENYKQQLMSEMADLIKDYIKQKPTECIKFNNEFENQVSNLIVSVLNGEHEYNEGFVKYVAQSLLGYAKNELKSTAWSEEDENMAHYIGNAITCKESAKYLEEKGIDMIKAHRWLESPKHQSKQEWSEEDERVLNSAIWHLRNSVNNGDRTYSAGQIEEWLKSLKERIGG